MQIPQLWFNICRKHYLKDHISSPHLNNKPYKCPHCDVIFAENIIWKVMFLLHIRIINLTNVHTAMWYLRKYYLKDHISWVFQSSLAVSEYLSFTDLTWKHVIEWNQRKRRVKKTQMEMNVAKVHHPMKIWRSTL